MKKYSPSSILILAILASAAWLLHFINSEKEETPVSLINSEVADAHAPDTCADVYPCTSDG